MLQGRLQSMQTPLQQTSPARQVVWQVLPSAPHFSHGLQ
jgi:hypothetical protein